MKVSQDFWEKIAILLATAALTGVLVPYVLKTIDYQKSIEQKRLDADLARQSKLIDAQARFLDETTEVLWEWRYLSMKVAFDAAYGQDTDFQDSAREYRKGIWATLAKLRNQTSKARRLISDPAHKAMINLYDAITAFDAQLDSVVRQQLAGPQRAAAFRPLHDRIRNEFTEKIDAALGRLADEAQLSVKRVHGS